MDFDIAASTPTIAIHEPEGYVGEVGLPASFLEVQWYPAYTSANALPAALPDEEMEILRSGICQGLRAEPHPFLTAGPRMRIICGPFAGLEGVLKRKKKNGLGVVVSLSLIQRSVAVNVDVANVAPAS